MAGVARTSTVLEARNYDVARAATRTASLIVMERDRREAPRRGYAPQFARVVGVGSRRAHGCTGVVTRSRLAADPSA